MLLILFKQLSSIIFLFLIFDNNQKINKFAKKNLKKKVFREQDINMLGEHISQSLAKKKNLLKKIHKIPNQGSVRNFTEKQSSSEEFRKIMIQQVVVSK